MSIRHEARSKARNTKPAVINSTNTKTIRQTRPAPIPPVLTRQYSDVIRNELNCNTDTPFTRNSTNDSSTGNAQLFSTAEIMKIFTTALGDLNKCKTKGDQLLVIMNLLNHVVD